MFYNKIQLANNKYSYVPLVILFFTNLMEQSSPEVILEQGVLRGKTSEDGTFYEYTGIPYAAINSSNRFQAPLPPPKWNGVFHTTDEVFTCPQLTKMGILGQVDCLRVNVYAPSSAKSNLPVMFFIHGGGFQTGTGDKNLYAPNFLMRHDVILVTFNYRVATLGFLCLGIKEAPGNAGLKDQLAALKWVKRNIASFGGDPDNITIFGESAGAASVSMFLANRATDGLFQKAILQSGSSIATWAINTDPIHTASQHVKTLGINTTDPYELYEIFSKMSLAELLEVPNMPVKQYFDEQKFHLPCVEKSLAGEEPFLTDHPFNLLKNKSINVPLIYGTNSNEGLLFVRDETDDTLSRLNGDYLFGKDINFTSEAERDHHRRNMKHFYFGEKQEINKEVILNVSDYISDLYFNYPTQLEPKLIVEKSNKSVYNYYFDYNGGRNMFKVISGYTNASGAVHGDELLYIFDAKVLHSRSSKKDKGKEKMNRADKHMIYWMTKLWTNFAKYGDPTPEVEDNLPMKWIPSSKGESRFLYINDNLQMGPMPDVDAYNLWDGIYSKYRRKVWV